MLTTQHLYPARYAWVEFKRALRLPIKTDRRHFCDRIVKARQAGRLHPQTVLTAGTMSDGLGSQLLCRMTTEAAAHALNMGYAYRPLADIDHGPANQPDWPRRCERATAISANLVGAETIYLPLADYMTYATSPQLWQRPHLVLVPHMYVYTDRFADTLNAPAQRMRPGWTSEPLAADRRLTIAVHVRRGDVSSGQNRHRFQSDATVLNLVAPITAILENMGLSFRVRLISNESPHNRGVFEKAG
jgi:hypothetical protein